MKRTFLLLCLLTFPMLAKAQVAPYSDIVLTSRGTPAGGTSIAVCGSPGLATTAAQVTSNIAILTMTSNPITAGFFANMTLTVSGFTGGDTYFNGTFTILTVTSTTLTYSLTHANASAGTNGSAFQTGNAATPCAPLSSIFSDPSGLVSIAQPGFAADGLGNFAFYAATGAYNIQFYGPVLSVRVKPINISCSGTASCTFTSITVSGTATFANINNVVYADQQSGADFCAKLGTSMNALPVAGGTVNALGFQGAQACGSNTTLSKSNVLYLLPPNITVSATSGITITISGSDVSFIGSGDTTLFDFSSGTSANDNIHVSGSRVRVEKIKINGNRVAGGTATCLSAFNSFTSIWITDNAFSNCGGQGIYAFGFSDGHITRNRFTSTRTGGVFLDTGTSEVWVTENTFSGTNTSNTGGQGGLTVNGNTSTFDSGFYVNFNKFLNTTGVPIQINSVSAAANRITRNAEAIGNFIDTTLTSGEGISFTANQYRIIGNRVTNTCVTGILVFGVPSGVDSNVVISDNIVSDSSKCVSGNNYGIQFAYGGASLAKMRVTDNIIFDDQGGSATTAGAVNFFNSGGAGTIADAVVSGNISRGNISATTVTFSQASDAANVLQFGNSGTSSGNAFLLGATLQNAAQTATMGLTLKTGSGGGYSGANTTYAAVDTTNLCATFTVPTGWKLKIEADGVLESLTAAVAQSVALADAGTTCSGGGVTALNGTERTITPPAIATFDEQFHTQFVFTGDGAAHSILLVAKTSNGADSWGIQNSSATVAPSLIYTLMPSN